MAFSSMTRFDDDLVAAVRDFYGLDVDVATAEADILEDEVERLRFYPWFLWDFRSSDKAMTIGERFIDETHCSDHETRILSALSRSYVSFFEALEDATHEGVWVRDLATGEKIHVGDEGLAGDLYAGHLVQTRLVRIEGSDGPITLVDAVYACLPPEARATVESELQNLLDHEGEGPGAAHDVAGHLKQTVAECIHFADHLLETLAQPPEPLNQAGEAISLCHATYRGMDAVRILQGLAGSHPAFQTTDDGLWSADQGDASLGFVHRIDGERVMLGSNTLERLEDLETLIEDAFGASRPVLRCVSDFNDAVRQWAEEGGGHPWLKGDREVAWAVQQWLQFWVRNWADIPSPILDGQTPREAMYEPHGRRRVENALERFEKLKFGGLDDELALNLDRIRGDLGLGSL